MLGPCVFVAAWVVAGAVAEGYSPVDDPISRLAAVGATTRPLMTAGFLGFGAGMTAFALGLRSALPGPAWLAALAAGAFTVGVAAVPLDGGHDALHGFLAGFGYVALLAVPVTATRRRGPGRTVALTTALVAAVCLAASTVVDGPNGLWQRSGLTILDGWVVVTALHMIRSQRPTVPAA